MRIAVFDLDGTITRHDTFVPYVLRLLARRPWQLLRLLGLVPSLLGFLLRIADHGAVKAALLRHTLRGRPRAELEAWTNAFVPDVIARGTFPRALEVIARHRAAGDRLVLLSASPDLYVPAIARALGFDEAICTGVRWEADRLDGALATPNCRGEEKARRIRALREQHPGATIVAYANGPADFPHLQIVDEPLLVNGVPGTRRRAKRLGIPIGFWR
ncbi:MAG TPA: HAD-IB family hydrolase [Steroidobacteraceae bacterium]|nr:HAD-IB family hydrolase [Steroidobacteraceae bacterium]